MKNLKLIGYISVLVVYVAAIILGIIFSIIAKQYVQLLNIVVLAIFGFSKVKEIYKYLITIWNK